MTMYTQGYNKVLSWSVRLIFIIQEFKFKDHELRQWKHKFLKRLDMYHELMHSEKQTKEPMKEEEFKK
jgi:hypothetical protein